MQQNLWCIRKYQKYDKNKGKDIWGDIKACTYNRMEILIYDDASKANQALLGKPINQNEECAHRGNKGKDDSIHGLFPLDCWKNMAYLQNYTEWASTANKIMDH